MSIFGKNIGISEQLRAELRIFFAVLIGSMFFVSDIVFAGCGFVDIAAISLQSATNRFIAGGYDGFLDQAGKTTADCYANRLKENGLLGANLLSTLSSNQTTDTINNTRGPNPKNELLVAHRGGPDWANQIPDNSIDAFKKSIANGISSVEVDLQMDSKRNLIAYHDVSFAGMVHTDDLALDVASKKAIQSYEWITRSDSTRKLDESKLLKLRRVIPNSFTFHNTVNDTTYLTISPAAIEPTSQINVSSFHTVISEIQAASNSVFGRHTAVNIFLDAAKSRDITIATINRLRRSRLINSGKIYNDIDSALAVPKVESIAVQFKINDFPGGADDMAQALCSSPENAITYKKSVISSREEIGRSRQYTVYQNTTTYSYTDSTDNFSSAYGQSQVVSKSYLGQNLKTGVFYNNGNPPVRLWGDAASGTCSTSHIENSGIALVPVVEKTVPYKATFDGNGAPTYPSTASGFAKSIAYFLGAFKKYFIMNIIEFSYTPLDMASYTSADPKQPINTSVRFRDIYFEMAATAIDSVFSNQKYIYQTFNRFYDINFINSKDIKYNGLYLCSAQVDVGDTYAYRCNTLPSGSLDEQGFEYRAKPGFYSGACNPELRALFLADSFGLTTTDNPLLEIYLGGIDFKPDTSQFNDLCTRDNQDGRMSNYTTRYRSFVGNPSFRLSLGI